MRKLSKQELITAILCLAVAGGLLYMLWFRLSAEAPIARNVNAPKTPYTACYHETGNIVTDTAYLLVDLSNTTSWPHTATNEVILKSIDVQGAVSGAHEWDLTIGVVVENDATNGTAVWIISEQLAGITGTFDCGVRYFAEGGLNLRATDSLLTYAVANNHSELTSWQNDTAISATVGTTATVAVGDVVIFVDEVSNGSTLGFSICVDYDTE